MAKNNKNIELLDRFMRGETSPEEEQLLLEWFRNSASRDEILHFYQQRWIETSDEELPAEVQGRMFLRIKERMHEIEESQKDRETRTIKPKSSFTRFLPYAATILLCIGIFSSYLYTLKKSQVASEYTVSAEKGQRASIVLPDGTKVWLNSHTELRYKSDYGVKERNVFLNGEAYFEVSKDKEHRFVVKSGEMEVEALGTSFNVKAYNEDPDFVATLFEGSIKAGTGDDNSVILTPNQHVSLNRQSRSLTVGTSENVSYARMWRNNELAFEREKLDDIAILLNRMYNVQLEFKSDKIRNYRFSGVIKNNSLDNVIEIISLTAPIIYESHGDTIILDAKP
ncbi:FecR domain-containing protein [Parabacteroides goldsteinii]|uniref:FecR family protein n=1 Tax=uncultured Parabacteroides sp. TaxID=512312 RepID=UPI00101C5647|nr:FecR domain-containing protein [Parabacteroides goldsteinii]